MDTNILQTLTGTAAEGASTKRADKPDATAFSACLDDAGHEKEAGKANVLIDDNKKKDTKTEAPKHDNAAQNQAKAASEAVAKLTPAMQKMMHRNVDTMSISDKQAMRIGEFSREGEIKQQAAAPKPNQGAVPVTNKLASSALAQASREPKEQLEKARPQAASKGEKFSLPGERDARENAKSDPKAANLDRLLAQEVKGGEQVHQADQIKAHEQRQNMLDQIIKHVEVRNFQNQTEMNLRLNPEYLGEMNINLVHSKDGGVTTNIKTSSRVTKELLQDCKDELVAQAEAKGIRLGKINVTLVDNVG